MVLGYGYHRISRIPVSEASSPSQTLAVVRTAELLAVSEGAVCSGPRGPRVVDHVIGLMEMILFWRKIYQKTMFSPWNLTIYIGFLNLFSKTIVQCPWGLFSEHLRLLVTPWKLWKFWIPCSDLDGDATLYTKMKHRNARLAGYVWKQTIGANTHTHIKNTSHKMATKATFSTHIFIYIY